MTTKPTNTKPWQFGLRSLMLRRTTVGKILGIVLVTISVMTVVFWDQISEAFGPMTLNESQCLICQRNRSVKWVCGSKVNDTITTNEYSDWIDTFTPEDHQHAWLVDTSYNRSYWFGGTSIGCGGIATIPRIFEQRSSLGELKSQQLAARFHELINDQPSSYNWKELDSFTKAVVDDPESLLMATSPD